MVLPLYRSCDVLLAMFNGTVESELCTCVSMLPKWSSNHLYETLWGKILC